MPRPKSNMRNCRSCRRTLPRDAFALAYRKDGRPSGVRERCKECLAAWHNPPSLLERLMEKIEPQANGCWFWRGSLTPNGYGIVSVHCKMRSMHRLMYELHRGPIPDGLQVCHRCDVRHCCNPDHLFLGTATDNMQDASRKGRTVKRQGSLHHLVKLTEEQVIEIRRNSTGLPGEQTAMARKYGVTKSNIGAILRRKSWCHLPD